MPDIFGVETLFTELVLALGAALALGNGVALWRHHRGSPTPPGRLRTGRALFLLVVGLVMSSWAILSLLAR